MERIVVLLDAFFQGSRSVHENLAGLLEPLFPNEIGFDDFVCTVLFNKLNPGFRAIQAVYIHVHVLCLRIALIYDNIHFVRRIHFVNAQNGSVGFCQGIPNVLKEFCVTADTFAKHFHMDCGGKPGLTNTVIKEQRFSLLYNHFHSPFLINLEFEEAIGIGHMVFMDEAIHKVPL